MADWSRTTDVPRRRFTMPRLNRDPQIITLPIYPRERRLFAGTMGASAPRRLFLRVKTIVRWTRFFVRRGHDSSRVSFEMEIAERPVLTKEQVVTFVYFELNFNLVSFHAEQKLRSLLLSRRREN